MLPRQPSPHNRNFEEHSASGHRSVAWTTRRGVESYRISERIWDSITDIYARLGDRFFKLADDIRLSPDIVAKRVQAFAIAHPTSTIGSAPERPADPSAL